MSMSAFTAQPLGCSADTIHNWQRSRLACLQCTVKAHWHLVHSFTGDTFAMRAAQVSCASSAAVHKHSAPAIVSRRRGLQKLY